MGRDEGGHPVPKREGYPRMNVSEITQGVSTPGRLALLLWGPAGAGKTTWAATAPGKKLWISYGDNEHAPVVYRKDVWVMNMAAKSFVEVIRQGIGDDPYGLDKYLASNPIGMEISTIVVDSLTQLQDHALEKAVWDGVGKSSKHNFVPSMEIPGIGAFGGRNTNLIRVMKSLLRVTLKHSVNIIFTAHENDATTYPDGVIKEISMSLGGQLINKVSTHLSEVWNFRQEPGGARNRIVTVRLHGHRRPMKTRMFRQDGKLSSFAVMYNPDLPDDAPGQMTLNRLCDQWEDNGRRRIPMPINRSTADEDRENLV
jgi:hypothetical protein